MKKLSSYLSAGLAATAAFQSSEAATIVTLYGPGARSPLTTPSTPTGIDFTKSVGNTLIDVPGASNNSYFAYGKRVGGGNGFFSSGSDLSIFTFLKDATYVRYGSVTFVYGAQSGSANYVNISFNGNDTVYEAVGQFNFDGMGGGYLVAIAKNDDNTALSISQGKAAIDAVPEPSAIALLSLGAGAAMMRRRRKVA
jgi:hypothetical protein